ncbi:MAG: hypothetical protein JST92_11470, partial [Deltaproteobacteria bacterium]|nr:hypothetical protein [Deltaproteobacteria bacterium]
LRASTRSPRRLLAFTLGALGPLLVLIAFKLHLHVHNDLVDAARTHPLTALVLEGSRWARIGRHLGQLALTFTDWGLALLLLPLALALALGWPAARTQAARALGLALLVQLAGLLLAFLITPHDLDWHLDTALDRVLLQAVPALVLWLFLRLTAAPAHSA